MKQLFTLLFLVLSVQAIADDILIIKSGGSTVMVPGFRTYASNGYVASEKNIELLKQVKSTISFVKPITLSSASPGNASLICRVSYPVYAPRKIPFELFIEDAVNTEIEQAGLMATDSSHTIKGHLDEFDFSSFGSGKWTIQATFSAEGKEPLTVKQDYAYPVSGGAVAACGEVANALVPAVQEFLYALYSNPRFVDLSR